ncbi:MAG: 4Fe-4S dicluster domain-containing protein [Clostridia bacterium]
MRGIHTNITTIRRQIFKEVANIAYNNVDIDTIDYLHYKMFPRETPTYRNNVFMERAVVKERIRLAFGLPVRVSGDFTPLSQSIKQMPAVSKPFTKDLVSVISVACNSCPENSYVVTNNCRGCLAHPCTEVCPVDAIEMVEGKSKINPEKCIRCGKCKAICPYSAIVHYERPCAAACGVDAIVNDEYGRAKINYDKCVSCGMCIVSCPFGAIADKSEIYQMITDMNRGVRLAAAVAPAIAGQLGEKISFAKMTDAFKRLGFEDVVEVALGADIGAVEEAKHFAHAVPNEQDFLATSCCPAWSVMAKRNFPEIAHSISDSTTPMIETARVIKQRNPDVKVVFVGPCIAKKSEATRESVKTYVDYVITFEELMGMMEAKGVNLDDITEERDLHDASSNGRGYACAGGVAHAIEANVKAMYPDVEIMIDRAEGLSNCKKMLTLAKFGKRKGYLLEGMACPGGCVGGPGTLSTLPKAQKAVKTYQSESIYALSKDNPHIEE